MQIQAASPIRSVLVCHEDPLIRLGLVLALQQSEFGSAVNACARDDMQIQTLLRSADVIVTDYDHGMACCATARGSSKSTSNRAHIVIVSNRDGEHEIKSAIDFGVKGYLLAGCALDVFVDGVRAAGRGTRYLCSTAAHRIVDSMTREPLTARELQVLECLVDGYVNKRICDELNIAIGTVKAHVKSVFSKLGVATRTQAVSLARSRGIVATPQFEQKPRSNLPFSARIMASRKAAHSSDVGRAATPI